MPSPTKASFCLAGLLRKQRLDLFDLARGQKIGIHLVHAQLFGDGRCNLFRVARQHDGLRHARTVQLLDCLFELGLTTSEITM